MCTWNFTNSKLWVDSFDVIVIDNETSFTAKITSRETSLLC